MTADREAQEPLTDAQLKVLDEHPEFWRHPNDARWFSSKHEGVSLYQRAAAEIRALRGALRERQAQDPARPADPAKPRCATCGTHEVELLRRCHNSACDAYAKDVTLYEGWRATPAEPSVRAALAELVACKDLKEQYARYSPPAGETKAQYDAHLAMLAEYKRRQPLAWEAARRALAQGADAPIPTSSAIPKDYKS